MEEVIKKAARFSEDRTERYWLTRIWGDPNNLVMFIGLNPSTADEFHDDPTIRRVIRFAKDWGYGGVVMCNLFVQVTPYPKELNLNAYRYKIDSPITSNLPSCRMVVAAWGNFKEAEERGNEIALKLPGLFCLGTNKNGTPKHPLYIKADTLPIPYRPNNVLTPNK